MLNYKLSTQEIPLKRQTRLSCCPSTSGTTIGAALYSSVSVSKSKICDARTRFRWSGKSVQLDHGSRPVRQGTADEGMVGLELV
ncbi:hypothetical protein F441_10212 [Phytophthora nicotianae CJ01A1]|uniref:Uncharacterized protein n=1 Tax=Phytophthora nicotianae CJ01A1 TaxID=1317063 RepID=W2WZ52_PHYNI|nr:hypothetical protein F441_10212 [Phytophthora nicotianae CJ01A1]